MSSDREPGRRRAALSLAVLDGPDRGKILRTGRTRVVVGSDPSSDLALIDPEVAPRHLRIELDGRDFRWEAGPERRDVSVDRSWVHPESREPGGCIRLGGTVVLVFAGELSDQVVQRELRGRNAIEEIDPGAETDTSGRPKGLDQLLGAPGADDKTIALVPERTRAIDAIALAAMPTLAKPGRPQVLSDQETRILGRDALGSQSPSASPKTWSPEAEAEPEVQPHRGGPSRNAWGDDPSPVSPAPPPRGNAWGDRPEAEPRALVPTAKPPRSAWDRARVTGAPSDPRAPGPESVGGTLPPPPGGGPAGHLPRIEILSATLLAGPRDPALQVLSEPDGEFATQVRLLGTRLGELFRGFGYRSFMLTSAEPLTGKTTVACNLALALSEDPNRRVALIETNFRFPRLGALLGLPPDRGLIGILEGRLDVLDGSARWKDRNLVVFPAGGRHPHPAELLAAPRLKTLVRDLLDTVDIAIIDAPSIRPGADSNLVLGLVDGALLVALDGHTKSREIDLAVEQIGRERVFGGLYNHTPPERARVLRTERKLRA